jgi:hypothetical protein
MYIQFFNEMKTFTSRLLIILVVVFSWNSCSQDDILPVLEGSRLLHEVWDGAIRKVYEYNDQGWPVAVKSKYSYNRYTYNEKNQLSRLEFFTDPAMFSSTSPQEERHDWVNPENTACLRYFTYEYDNNKRLKNLLTYSRWDGPFEMIDYATLDYDNAGRIIRRNWFNSGGIQQGFVTYRYDAKGNMVETIKYYMPDPQAPASRSLYEFDDQVNPYRMFRQSGQPGRSTNPNNIVREISDVYDLSTGTVEYHSEMTYHYQYNALGYPVKINDAELVYR